MLRLIYIFFHRKKDNSSDKSFFSVKKRCNLTNVEKKCPSKKDVSQIKNQVDLR